MNTSFKSVTLQVKDSAPLKLPTRYCFDPVLRDRLAHTIEQSGISLTSRSHPKTGPSNLSHLCYAAQPYTQYQAVVKLLGSFRLTAGNRHLHRYCIFTELCSETVPQSLHYSCASELTRQGISLGHSMHIAMQARTLSSSDLLSLV